jgi:Flp pilus assembly protein TadD
LPAFAAAWVAYLIILAPNSGLVRYSSQLAADRYSYAASLPWVAVLAGGLVYAIRSRAWVRTTSVAIMVGVVALGLSMMSWFQSATWRNSLELWTHALEAGSDRSLEAHGNFALALSMVGLEAEALEQCQAAMRVAPHSPKACMALAQALARQGKNPEAITMSRQAVQAAPDMAMTHYSLGCILGKFGQPDQAEVSVREAIRLDPGYCDAHNGLGALLAARGQIDEARHHFETALQIRPNDPVARSNLEHFLVGQTK